MKILYFLLLLLLVPITSGTVLETFDEYTDGFLPCVPDTMTPPCTTAHGNDFDAGNCNQKVESAIAVSGKAFQVCDLGEFCGFCSAFANFDTNTELCNGNSIIFSFAASNLINGGVQMMLVDAGNSPLNNIYTNYYIVMSDVFTGSPPIVGQPYTAYVLAQIHDGGAGGNNFLDGFQIEFTSNFQFNTFYTFIFTCPNAVSGGNMTLLSVDSGNSASGNVPANPTAETPNGRFILNGYGCCGFSNQAYPVYYDNIGYDYSVPVPVLESRGCNANGNSENDFIFINKTFIANSLCTSTTSLNWMLAIWLICICVIVAGSLITGSPAVTIIAAFAGVGLGIAFGVIPVWFLILSVFLILALMFAIMSSGGEY